MNAARSLLTQLSGNLASSGTGQLVKDTLAASIDAAQKLIDNSGVTDTKLLKAAKVPPSTKPSPPFRIGSTPKPPKPSGN